MNRDALSSSPLTLAIETSPDEAARDDDGSTQAGLHGVTFFHWMFSRLLRLAEPFRKQGLGSRLRSRAEALARERRAANCFLDTFSFQAPGFYEKHGYREFGRLDDQPPGYSRIWFSKRL